MRNLNFTVSGQKLSRAKGCDFSSIVAGTYGYLRAHFIFSKEWDGCKKVAVFSSQGKEYPVALQYNSCNIPEEALHGSSVQVYVVGRRDGYQITTDVSAFPQLVRH